MSLSSILEDSVLATTRMQRTCGQTALPQLPARKCFSGDVDCMCVKSPLRAEDIIAKSDATGRSSLAPRIASSVVTCRSCCVIIFAVVDLNPAVACLRCASLVHWESTSSSIAKPQTSTAICDSYNATTWICQCPCSRLCCIAFESYVGILSH